MLQYLNITSAADFALDTFPVSGGTVILHNLWIGMPTLTLRADGQTGANNAAASTLSGVGLEECIASSTVEYIDIGKSWLNDPDQVSKLRQKCRPCLQASNLMDFKARVAEVEESYREFWKTACE